MKTLAEALPVFIVASNQSNGHVVALSFLKTPLLSKWLRLEVQGTA